MVAVSFMVIWHMAQILFRETKFLDGLLSSFGFQCREGCSTPVSGPAKHPGRMAGNDPKLPTLGDASDGVYQVIGDVRAGLVEIAAIVACSSSRSRASAVFPKQEREQ